MSRPRVLIKKTPDTISMFHPIIWKVGMDRIVAWFVRYDGEYAIVEVRDLDGIYDEYHVPRHTVTFAPLPTTP